MLVKQVEFTKSSANLDQCPKERLPEYAFVGRSNVGKSSLVNTLLARKSMAKTSATPGKTQLINHFKVNENWFLVDLPGYGWARMSKSQKQEWGKILEHYLLQRERLVCVFVLVDLRLPPQKIDVTFLEWLGEEGLPFHIVFTKADKLGKNKIQKNIAAYKKDMLKTWEEMPPYFVSSSVSKIGREDILNYINELNQEFKQL